MRHPTVRRCALALVLGLFTAAEGRGEAIPWYYSSIPIPGDLLAKNGPPGKIALSGATSGQITGSSSIVLANLDTLSTASPADPAVFKHAGYELALTIVDADSDKVGTLFFTGKLKGSLSSSSALLFNHFTGATTQSEVIGNHLYTVTIGPFAPPGVPGAGLGTISASVTVSDAPEPSTLALAGLGLSLVGVRWWRRRSGKTARTT